MRHVAGAVAEDDRDRKPLVERAFVLYGAAMAEQQGGARILERVDEAGVALLTLNRPERKNAFDNRMWAEFLAALRRLLADPAVRVVVLRGAGGDFTAGADMAVIDDPGAASEQQEGAEHPFSIVLDLLTGGFDKPLLAAVDGVAVGFGLTVLLHCDLVWVSERARLRAPFVRLGVVPEAGASFLLPALVGYRRAARILFTGDWIAGPEAVELGIAEACLEPEQVVAAALEAAARIAAGPPGAVRATKRLLLETRRDQVRAALAREADAFAARLGTPENVEAIRAFYEKRKPDFSKLPRA